ncbi:AMP-binding protein [Flavobacteriaceae bacterium]|nr:AMP-binding protein [Flavobacteriaceae bacterium]
MNKSFFCFHPNFSIQGRSFNEKDLRIYATSLLLSEKTYLEQLGTFLLEWLSEGDEISVFTSGSTGTPKSLSFKKRAMQAHAQLTGQFFNLIPGNRILLCLPMQFIAGKMMVVRALSLGLDLWVCPPSNSPLDFFKTTFDFVAMVPTQLEGSISLLSYCRKILIGGAPLNKNLKRKAIAAIQDQSTKLFLSYGMTETLSHIAIAKLKPEDQVIFSVLPQITIEENARGCLRVIAPYIGPDPIDTKDVVRILDASHFEWMGRLDFVINSGGVKIHPESLEKAYGRYFSFPFFYSGIPHDSLGEQLVLVVLNEDLENVLANLTKISFDQKFHKPKGILTVPQFLYTNSLKLRRKDTLALGYHLHNL